MFNDSVETFVTFMTKISNFLPLEVRFSVAFTKANYTRVFAMGYTSLISVQVRQEIKTSEIAVGVHFCLEYQARPGIYVAQQRFVLDINYFCHFVGFEKS